VGRGHMALNALDGDVQMRRKWLSITNTVIKPNPALLLNHFT
jgi:hypothetical protein